MIYILVDPLSSLCNELLSPVTKLSYDWVRNLVPRHKESLSTAKQVSAHISAMDIVEFGLENHEQIYDNAPKIYHHGKKRYEKMRGRNKVVYDESISDKRVMEEKGLVLRKRSEVRSDEEIVEVVRHRGQKLARRPGMERRASSMDNPRDGAGAGRGRNNDRRVGPYRGGAAGGAAAAEDSEGSVPPQSRTGRGRAKSMGGKSGRASSTSSSELGSTTDDEKKCRKMQRKKWITAGLAGVATIHAASSLYSSVENHDKRILQVEAGEISPEEAHKKQRQARWQDAASIAIAALGIKGALSEWKEVQEQRHEHAELLENREERHKKRLEHERRKRAREQHNGYYSKKFVNDKTFQLTNRLYRSSRWQLVL